MSLGGGDKLARGGVKAQFPSCSFVSQEKWDAIWAEDNDKPIELGGSDTLSKEAGNVSPLSGEDIPVAGI